ncbi:hypothetical protein [Actinoplanes sp. NBRC 101535]|uniref:hypothetical protein n=1 Tax=Actinoplanes sp. NBRC 101535 TaxID=3032196 RepID=UPI0024A5BE50|nr:hypothetical protein [Actinoplanes sp. NBRC 101535]GLY08198.1 hypothetical protein Acsp01_85770 [Actinoplanes sp. NBRC 101535]
MLVHPAGAQSAAQQIVQLVQALTPGWREEADETSWRTENPEPDSMYTQWLIVATGQLHPWNPFHGRPGPLVVAFADGVETRIQLPGVVDGGDLAAVVEALQALGALPSALAG